MKCHPLIVIPVLLGAGISQAEETPPPSIEPIRQAEGSGDAEGQFQLGRAYLRGEGLPKDVKKAFDLMKSAADQGHADAIGGMGYFYSAGVAVVKDETQAMEWFRKGAEKGSAKAQLNLGKTLLAKAAASPGKVREEGLEWTKKAADQGLTEAELSYGSILYFGDKGVPKNEAEATIYIRNAAEAGNPDAQNMLGTIEEKGVGVRTDKTPVEQWFRKAALQGHAKAQSNLGRMLWADPAGGEKRVDALAWFMISNSQGEITAKKLLEDYTPGLKPGDLDAAKKKMTELKKQVRKIPLSI